MVEQQAKQLDWDLYVAVAIGGMIGACFRHLMSVVISTSRDGWPMPTFLTNMTGCLILGIVLVIARELFPDPEKNKLARRFRPFVVTGILGGYTTFSTYMVETHGLVDSGQPIMAVVYAVGSLVGGVLIILVTMAIGDRLTRKVPPPTAAEKAVSEAELLEEEEEA